MIPPQEESSGSDASSSSEESVDSFGSLGELIDIDALSDGPVPVTFLSEDDVPMEWTSN